MSTAAETQPLDDWVREQLAAFAPLRPADLAVLAAILGYGTETYLTTTEGTQR